MDTPPEPHYDRFTRLAVDLVGAPLSLLTLLDDRREFIKSSTGPRESSEYPRELPLDHSLCRHIVESGSSLLIEDAAVDPLVRDSPAVTELGIAAYAGMPVRLSGEHVLGGLCVIDHEPRTWQPGEVSRLQLLSETLGSVLEQHVAVLRAERTSDDDSDSSEDVAPRPPFRALVEQSLVGLLVIDESGFAYVNPRVAEIFGYERREILEMASPAQLAVDADRELVRDNIARRLRGDVDDLRYSFRGRRKDGRSVIVDVKGVRTRIEDRNVIVGSVLDVTRQRRAERALRTAEQRYRMVVRATSSAVWDWDVHSGRVLWNGYGRDLLRYRSGEMDSTITWWYERLHPDDRRSVISSLQKVLEGVGDTWTHEHRFQRGDGSYATVLNCCSVLRDDDGDATRVIGSISDVTERKRQEETQAFLARASALLTESFDNELALARLARLAVPILGDCCVLQLVDGGKRLKRTAVAHVDPAIEAILLEETPGAIHEWLREVTDRVLASGKPLLVSDTGETTIIEDADRGGVSHFRSAMLVPLLTGHQVIGVLTFAASAARPRYGPLDLLLAEDLAHRVELAIEHEMLLEEAHAAVAARDDVLGIVTHDLINPLNVIQLTAEFLMEEATDRRTENLQQLQLIRRASSQALRLVRELLEITRLEGGGYPLDAAEQQVGAVLAEAIKLLDSLAQQNGVRLVLEPTADLPPLRVDADRIQRVLANLIGNGIKFTPEGGVVRVSARRQGGEVCFTVTDTGPGIAPELLSHVFDRFWQARRGDRRGAGLGLAIAKGIVEAHGGRIWATSPPGQGASFAFTLPLAGE